ncbi:phage baseplate protein [Bordetella pseudohinzii]|uniref:phage baseplate assembly protein V n=1 Tax=Bordetella pseudohinzii TaxID=1331258 RepID=UPI00076494FA|nr:phage baseplate assembly protein V [Bordetella pseudohinzii]KXA78998.1 phage baseplate protein [Bordetella pseudohinzii]
MFREIEKRISRALGQLRQAFRAVIARVNSGPSVQLVSGQGVAGEQLRDNELFQHYGFTSCPPSGTMAITLPLGGKTSHGVIIATEHATYRLVGLQEGELAIYTDEGTKMVIKRGRVIETDCDEYRLNCKTFAVNATESSTFTTPTLTASEKAVINGLVTGKGGLALSGGEGGVAAEIDGGLRATGKIQSGNVSLDDHDHNETGSVTGKPNPIA